ncbi:MAG: hypothetical protein KAY37_11955 [Phycisphaerae bacterium]|nr:hypothetical protein [Phycisphaerae bacterium]
MNTISQLEIEKLVQNYLDQHRDESAGYRLNVEQNAARLDGDWWCVVVVPDRNGVRAHDYAERVTDIAEKLQDQEELKVLLVPALVDD